MSDREYFAKRVGWHRWEVWFRGEPDPYNGATEWRAVWGVKFWRRLNALRVAQDLQCAYRDGLWVSGARDASPTGA
jgi:hypothetical protein